MEHRILTTYAWYKPAGLGRRLVRAVSALAAQGYGVDYVGVSRPPLDDPNIAIHLLGASDSLRQAMPDHKDRYSWVFYMWFATWRCLKMALSKETVCLMAFSYGASFPLLLSCLVSRKPLVVFLRSNEIQENRIKNVSWPMRVIFQWLEKCSVRLATKVVAITEALSLVMKERHGRAVENKLVLLYNDLPATPDDLAACCEETRRLAGDTADFVITMNGPFNERKNVETLIRAFAEVDAPHARLLLIGDGHLMGNLKDLARELGAEDRVVFTGWMNGVNRITAGADLFVLPSLAEGVSNSLLEALTAGVPSLCSAIPEHVELFDGNEPVFDAFDVSGLSAKLQRAVHDREFLATLRNRCAEAGRKLTFDWDAKLVDIVSSMRS